MADARPLSPTPVVAMLRAAGCVFAEDEAAVLFSAARTADELDDMVQRRCSGLPLEQVVGWAEFHGLRIVIEPGVFVPRRRTELMADEAVALAGGVVGTPVVLDLCCGAGALVAAVAAAVDPVELHAADIEPGAVRCARRNIGERGRVYEGDLFEPLPEPLRGRVDVMMANVPYVPTGEIALLPAEARLHEPRVTLDGGVDGLRVLERVAAAAPAWLAPGGSLLVETSERQATQALEILRGYGLVARVTVDDDLGATVLIGQRP